MSKPTILIVGNSLKSLTSYLLEHDYEYITLKDIRLTKFPNKKLKRRVLCDFSSDATILAAVDSIPQKIDGMMVIYENFVRPAAKIAEYLKIPGMPLLAAEACTNKYLMRQLFMNAPEKISPDFAEITSHQDLLDFAKNHAFPLILKPANLSKSLLVFKNDSLDELLANYERTLESIDRIYAKYAPTTTPKIIIEEFMVGAVHSVDAFVDKNGEVHVLDQVVDYQTGYDIGYDDNFHYSRLLPSRLSQDDINRIKQVATMGCQALGMRSSPAHVEIIRTVDGPMIVEIGARNGGYRERMHGLANGIDITASAINIALGKVPSIVAQKNDSVGVFELFPKQSGVFASIANEAALRALPSCIYVSTKAKSGSNIGKSSEGFKASLVVILHNADRHQFEQDRSFLDTQVNVETT